MKSEWFGFLGRTSAADSRRIEFNLKNEQIVRLRKRPELLFIGDSITHNWETDCYFPEYYTVNRGIGGDISEDLKNRFQADALDLEPERIVLLVGINDLNQIAGDRWWRMEGPDPETVTGRLIANLREIVKMGNDAGIPMYVGTLLPVHFPEFFGCSEVAPLVRRVNGEIRRMAEEGRLILVDYESAFERAEEGAEALCRDGLHPIASGYAVMADCLRKALR